MKRFKRSYINIFLISIFIFPEFVYGYLDPGTGSYLLQIILAALLGIGVGVRAYWSKIKELFKKKNKIDE